jgi:serine/threonine protein kinase
MTDTSGKISRTTGEQSRIAPAPNYQNDELIGFELAEHYKIVELIGTGGWGNVYLGKHLTLGTDLAIKVMHKHLSRSDASLRRLEQAPAHLMREHAPPAARDSRCSSRVPCGAHWQPAGFFI